MALSFNQAKILANDITARLSGVFIEVEQTTIDDRPYRVVVTRATEADNDFTRFAHENVYIDGRGAYTLKEAWAVLEGMLALLNATQGYRQRLSKVS